MNRDLEYWQEKASMMVEDYTPELQKLMTETEVKELTDLIGTRAEKDYLNQPEQAETDPMSEMIAREFIEQMMQEMLQQKLKSLQPEEDDEENISEEEMELFMEYMESLGN